MSMRLIPKFILELVAIIANAAMRHHFISSAGRGSVIVSALYASYRNMSPVKAAHTSAKSCWAAILRRSLSDATVSEPRRNISPYSCMGFIGIMSSVSSIFLFTNW